MSHPLAAKCDQIIRKNVLWAVGAGAIPVPVADFFAVSAIQLDMLRQISELYGVEFSENEGKSRIATLAGVSLSRIAANLIKFIPGLGSLIGGLTASVVSGASTYAIGEVFQRHFESGGTFLDIDMDDFKHFYDEAYERGKDLAENLRERFKNATDNDDEEVTDKKAALDNLNELHEAGVLNKKEYERLKKRLD